VVKESSVPRFPRSRLALSLALGLLLVALGGGAALGATGNADSFWLVPKVAPHAFPASSCNGPAACDGVTGTIGKNSCNGFYACTYVSGTVGNDSCLGFSACYSMTGNVGNGSCDDGSRVFRGQGYSCDHMTGNAGNHACTGAEACAGSGDASDGSCRGYLACLDHTKTIGIRSCIGESACYEAQAAVGRDSCRGDLKKSSDPGCENLSFPVGDYACNGGNDTCNKLHAQVPTCARNLPGFVPAPCQVTRSVMGSSEFPNVRSQPVDLWATVIARYPVMGTPRGTFQFRLDGQPLGSPAAIGSNGRAHVTVYLRPGTHWVTGRYQGDGTFVPSVPVARLYQYVLAQ
jgi:hypothetical protein